jgi:transglutaminase/protease-like cytokinesis protein 3
VQIQGVAMFGLLSWLFGFIIRILLSIVFYGTPLLGLWLASSLAAYMAGPPYLPWAVGVLMFLIFPGLWELYSWMHRNREKKAWFTPLDRISMRIFAVGLVFLAVMIYLYPKTSFVALSTRGDWMLDGVKDPRAEQVRPVLFTAANGLEWLYKLTKKNPYKRLVDPKAQKIAEQATKQREQQMAKQKEQQIALATDAYKKNAEKAVDQKGGKDNEQKTEKTTEPGAETKVEQKNGQFGEQAGENSANDPAVTTSDKPEGKGDSSDEKISEGDKKKTLGKDGKLAQEGEKSKSAQKEKFAEKEGSKLSKPEKDEKHKKEKTDKQNEKIGKSKDDQKAKQADKKSKNKHEEKIAKENDSTPKTEKKIAKSTARWPWKGSRIHPLISKIPKSAESSIESVAQYIAAHEADPVLRIKALHDYVADRIAYDCEQFYAHNIHDQDAETVFRKRKGVCAGYANLLSAMASAVNEKIIVVIGDARDPSTGDKLTGVGHAWNAACIGDSWYLIDSFWDAGYISREKGFTKAFKLDYFMPPPQVMIQDHFPDETSWQLLASPISQGEFLRQPMLSPGFQAASLKLISPRRPRNEATEAMVILKNPKNEWLIAGLEQNGKSVGYSTNPTNSETAQIVCPLPSKGTYRMNMFVNDRAERDANYEYVGSVDFVNR